MSTVEQIVAAASRLKPAEFQKLRRRLDRLEKKLWDAELGRTATKMSEAGITDKDIDRMVMRRRHESRR